jgi:NAD(P)-dependent dehydrogenase (short-subunit alcohol dehydrogenase family)
VVDNFGRVIDRTDSNTPVDLGDHGVRVRKVLEEGKAGHRAPCQERRTPVAIGDVDEQAITTAKTESDGGRSMVGVVMHVADMDSIGWAITEVEATSGPAPILVNNAALFVSLPYVGG